MAAVAPGTAVAVNAGRTPPPPSCWFASCSGFSATAIHVFTLSFAATSARALAAAVLAAATAPAAQASSGRPEAGAPLSLAGGGPAGKGECQYPKHDDVQEERRA